MKHTREKHFWWQEGVIYQIFVRSFLDSNNDGIGDLPGITRQLDYLRDLGVRALCLSPVYSSPLHDAGYDITDFTNIHPHLGEMADLETLLQQVHARRMKLILDLVPNHTSDQHPWFLAARSGQDNPKRDWYLWADARPDGSPPNNWQSRFGGSGWEWDAATQQYYYHTFLKSQPDLNWRNLEVQQAMLQVMRFWLNKGIDGFRLSGLTYLVKDAQWRDNPDNPDYKEFQPATARWLPVYSGNQPEVHDIIRRMRMLTNVYKERVLIGDLELSLEKLVKYYSPHNKGVHLPLNQQLFHLPWNAGAIARVLADYLGALPVGGWGNWILGNQDQVRIGSRVGKEQARVAALLLLTLRGTPFMYYGEEIGMRDVPVSEGFDPLGQTFPENGRDPARTPLQWDDSPNAGFTSHRPWLRLADDYRRVNVSLQEEKPLSMLNFYRRLIGLRNEQPALNTGTFRLLPGSQQVLAYLREQDNHRYLVVLNLSHRPAYFRPEAFSFQGMVVLGTLPEAEGKVLKESIDLNGDEGLLVRLQP